MALQVRKINRAKWREENIVKDAEIPADGITNCLRTQQNNLSVWEIKSEDEIENAVIAIVSAQTHPFEPFDIVLLNPEYLEQNGVNFTATEGITTVKKLKDTHFHMVDLTYKKLGIVARHIVEKFKEKKVLRYTRKELKDILKNAINENKLDINELSEVVKNKLYING